MSDWKVPLALPDLTGNEERYLLQAFRSSWISSTGKFVDRFEEEFADLCGSRSALGVANGTVGLHLAMAALDVAPGDEVIVPSLTYVATANAVVYQGAKPVFVDVDPGTWCLDAAQLAAAVTSRTVGIIAVHLYGHPADMDAINDIAARYGLWVVEDAAEAHFARYKERVVGSLGTMAVFSFYGNKIITSGEGGAVTTSDPELAGRLRLLRGQGMDPERRYFFPVVGYNYRLTNVACALLCAQLERCDSILQQRRTVDAMYREGLSDIPGVGLQPAAPWAAPVPWLESVTIDPASRVSRDELMAGLKVRGIETRPFFIPIHSLPPYVGGHGETELPVTDRLARTGLSLPTYTGLGRSEVGYVVDAVRELMRGEA